MTWIMLAAALAGWGALAGAAGAWVALSALERRIAALELLATPAAGRPADGPERRIVWSGPCAPEGAVIDALAARHGGAGALRVEASGAGRYRITAPA